MYSINTKRYITWKDEVEKTVIYAKNIKKKYPDKIVAIYQKENLYSKGVAIIEEQMLDKAKGKYIAFCECDDKWTDSRKLEMQYQNILLKSRILSQDCRTDRNHMISYR